MLLLTPRRRSPAAVAAFVVLVAFAAGCGGGSPASTTSSSPPGTASSGALTIKNFAFTPNPLAAKAGDTITVTNGDGTDHQVVADDNSFDTGVFADGTRTFTVTKAGTVNYHCKIHSYMTGAIQVAAP